ncbi:MAG: hypothetical protein OZ929_06090 [Bryobacterales bacterium]|nr:hypothetical protein [Bryobacterales bacterium]
MQRRTVILPVVIASVAALLISCTPGPAPLKPGTPGFYWVAAKEAHRSGNYVRTGENLARITASENEYKQRAQVWLMVISSGIAGGLMEVADTLEQGARYARTNAPIFRRQVTAARASANQAAFQCAETFHAFLEGDKPANLLLDFDYPADAVTEPVQLSKIAKGIVLPAAEYELLEKAMIRRGVANAASRVSGAGQDHAKAAELFQGGNAEVPREVFVLGMAEALYNQSELYKANKLDLPNRLKLMCDEALGGLDTIPMTPDARKLKIRIQGTIQKIRLS